MFLEVQGSYEVMFGGLDQGLGARGAWGIHTLGNVGFILAAHLRGPAACCVKFTDVICGSLSKSSKPDITIMTTFGEKRDCCQICEYLPMCRGLNYLA